MDKINTVALIVAGGTGSRCICRLYNSTMPKQYAIIEEKPILIHTIKRFLDNENVHRVRVVIRKDHESLYTQAISSISNVKLLCPIYGGERRQDSVRLGLESIEEINPDIVIIHDACRPFTSNRIINNVISFLNENNETTQGVVPATSITDTVKIVIDSSIQSHICRNTIKALQTPQAFKFNDILTCHKLAYATNLNKEFTDDSSVMAEFDKSVAVIDGDNDNLKITTHEDLYRAQVLQANLVTTTTMG